MFQSLVTLSALAGVAISFVAWASEGTGITGTPGAFLALCGALAVFVGSAALQGLHWYGRRSRVLVVLVALGAFLTSLAARFLMQDALTLVMAFAFVIHLAARFFTTGFNRRYGRAR